MQNAFIEQDLISMAGCHSQLYYIHYNMKFMKDNTVYFHVGCYFNLVIISFFCQKYKIIMLKCYFDSHTRSRFYIPFYCPFNHQRNINGSTFSISINKQFNTLFICGLNPYFSNNFHIKAWIVVLFKLDPKLDNHFYIGVRTR